MIKQNENGNFPLGVTKIDGGVHISASLYGESCNLLLFEKESCRKIPFSKEQKVGTVWSMTLLGEDFSEIEYAFEVDGKEMPDHYGCAFSGREVWGELQTVKTPMRTPFLLEPFDWEGDSPLKIPYEETILYRIHPRGFTRHFSSKVKDKGTFKGIQEKISYIKELGVTALELMPPNEFEEVIMPDKTGGNPYGKETPTGKVNYWGYTGGFHFAPKASYASGNEKHPVTEFKELVKCLHKNQIELIIELYFSGQEVPSMVLDVIRFWVREYHIDGIHLVGFADAGLLISDPYLADTKLFSTSWEHIPYQGKRCLGEYNDGFLVDMRRLLRGDEDQLSHLIFRSRRNPKEYGVIHYIANTNGFTAMDMVSYDMKHNEENGEQNRDGSSWNYSWNCGVEGPTRRQKVLDMRKKQLRNAFLLLFLSQGTPLILSGDEFGSTKKGNNNSYCQDNEISWLNWKLLNTNRDIYEFVRYVISFRKKHPVFHMKEEPKNIDYLACGYPDVSYHGVKTWCPEFDNFQRQLGILYCGMYGQKPDGSFDDFFFVVYNTHWEPHEFALPNLPKSMAWHIAFNTDEQNRNGIYEEGAELLLEDQKRFTVPDRSIVVFIGLDQREVSGKKQTLYGKRKVGYKNEK